MYWFIMAPYNSPPDLGVAPSPFTMVYIPWGSRDHQIDSLLEKTIIVVGPNPPHNKAEIPIKTRVIKGFQVYIYIIYTNPGSPSQPNGLPLGRIRNPSHFKERSLLFCCKQGIHICTCKQADRLCRAYVCSYLYRTPLWCRPRKSR